MKNKKVFSLALFYYDLKKNNKTYDEIKSNLGWANKITGKTAKPQYNGVLHIGQCVLEESWCKKI